jgi:hypothetical protein
LRKELYCRKEPESDDLGNSWAIQIAKRGEKAGNLLSGKHAVGRRLKMWLNNFLLLLQKDEYSFI